MKQSEIKSPVIFGEVLADCFPDGTQVLGGAPFNVAWHLQAFGAAPLMVSSVGQDALGEQILDAMRGWGMDTSGIHIDATRKSGVVDVRIEAGEPHYDIVDNSAWDNIQLPATTTSSMLYHGTLAMRHQASRNSLQQLRQQAHTTFVDINLRPPWYAIETVRELAKNAQWLKLNEHELKELVPQQSTVEAQLEHLHDELAIQNILLTMGEAGAWLSRGQGVEVRVKPERSTAVVDTVGAGDAFSSVMFFGILNHWPLDTCMERAQSFASKIVGQRGATVSDPEFYARVLQDWA